MHFRNGNKWLRALFPTHMIPPWPTCRTLFAAGSKRKDWFPPFLISKRPESNEWYFPFCISWILWTTKKKVQSQHDISSFFYLCTMKLQFDHFARGGKIGKAEKDTGNQCCRLLFIRILIFDFFFFLLTRRGRNCGQHFRTDWITI